MMKVYVLESGVYANRFIRGIYSTLAKAQMGQPGQWTEVEDDYWSNGLDWDDARGITMYEVDED